MEQLLGENLLTDLRHIALAWDLNRVLRDIEEMESHANICPKEFSQLISSVFLVSMFKLESTENS